MSIYQIVTTSPIAVHKAGEEGSFNLYPMGNGDTASFDPNSLPQWALDESIAVADLKDLKDWLLGSETSPPRIGEEEYNEMALQGKFQTLEFDCIKWTCIDDNENLVVREASADARSEWLADLLGLEAREPEDFDAINADAEAVHKSYIETPTDERSLAEAEGKTFEEVKKDRMTG